MNTTTDNQLHFTHTQCVGEYTYNPPPVQRIPESLWRRPYNYANYYLGIKGDKKELSEEHTGVSMVTVVVLFPDWRRGHYYTTWSNGGAYM